MKVVILGAGKAGKFLYDEILEKAANNISVIAFGDNLVTGEYRGKKIYNPDLLLSEYQDQLDAVLIAAGAQKTVKMMMRTALSHGIMEIYMLHDIAGKCQISPFDDNGNIISERLRKIEFSYEKPTLLYFEVPITDRCNLNCKGCLFGCNTLSNAEDIQYIQIKEDANKVKELFHDIPWIRILGGEPLLHPQIMDILQMYRLLFPKSEIDLCTNGLLIPKMPQEFFETLKKERITIHISGYKPVYQMLDRIDEILRQHNLNYTILKRDSFAKYYTLNADKDMKNSYDKCIASGCCELYKGKLLRCSAVLAFEKFNMWFDTNYELRENEDYFDIHKENLDAWSLKTQLDKASNVCRYCDVENTENFTWDYSGKNITIKDYVL